MTFYVVLSLLLLGGGIGWSLFFYIIAQTYAIRKHEVKIISEIRAELQIVKDELNNIKKIR